MENNKEQIISNRYDFMFLFDVTDGNPNGEPDTDNQPRFDPETNQGLVSDVCLKRKLRNRIQFAYGKDQGYDIFVKQGTILNDIIDGALPETYRDRIDKKQKVKKEEKNEAKKIARETLCQEYYDIRSFGAVLSTGKKYGGTTPVRGPVQLTFARSYHAIKQQLHTITRMAATTEEETETKQENRTMGNKWTVPYGLYCCYGFISPLFAQQTQFNELDLQRLWESFSMLFEDDRSAARGLMVAQKLFVFKHESHLGNAAAHKLFQKIQVQLRQPEKSPRSFSDYQISTPSAQELPDGVELLELI